MRGMWLAVGIVTGMIHARSLWTSARVMHPTASIVLRLILTTAVLAGAASVGQLLPAGVGWACGLAAAAVVLYARQRP